MRALKVAIERIHIDQDYNVEYVTIGGGKPLGLCGSAVIDLVAEMYRNDIINQYGRFNPKMKNNRLKKNGATEFVIAWQK